MEATASQPVLADVPAAGRFLVLGQVAGTDPRPGLERVRERPDPARVVGLGDPLLRGVGVKLPALRPFPALSGPGVAIPSTQGAVWVHLAGADAGEILLRAVAVREALGSAFRLEEDVATFRYGTGRDLSGFEDGTENPKGDKAAATALVSGAGAGLDGSTFVAGQRWVHDLAYLRAMAPADCDAVFGRSRETNEELADAPATAHVKRAAQESYEPPAFLVRRSMPWGDVAEHGLYFVAYGASLDPFERVLRRMAGLEDGLTDALMAMSRPVSGGYYWCPPLLDGRLDLRAIGL